MKKIIFLLACIFLISLTVKPIYSISLTQQIVSCNADGGDKKKVISIGSNRASGEIQLRFTAPKAGEATITILDESGNIVLQQTNQVTKSVNTIALKNATGLNEGSYTVRLVSNNEIYSTRLLIWK